MKKIEAYQCEFCNKILKTRSGMKNHELKCFSNPQRRACLICRNLSTELFIDGQKLTEKEHLILQYKVEGTFYLVTGCDDGHHYDLNEEYKYLYNAEPDSFCDAKNIKLNRLTFNCNRWAAQI